MTTSNTINNFTAIEPDDFYILPDDKGETLFKHLDSAAKNIDLVIYSLSSTDIQNRLLSAKKRGVNISIMHNSQLNSRDWRTTHGYWHLFQTIESLNKGEGTGKIDVRWSSNNFFLTHQKTFLIDAHPDQNGVLDINAKVVIMTHNLHNSKALGFPPTNFWDAYGNQYRDMGYVFKNETIVKEVYHVFKSDFDGDGATVTNGLRDSKTLIWTNGSFLNGNHSYPPVDKGYFDKYPKSTDNQGNTEFMIDCFSMAKHSIEIYTEVIKNVDGILEHLDEAIKSGVSVKLIENSGLVQPGDSSYDFAKKLLGIGVEIKFIPKQFDIHGKAIIIDGGNEDGLLISGSQNFTIPALNYNRELSAIMKGPVVTKLRETFYTDWNSSGAVGLENIPIPAQKAGQQKSSELHTCNSDEKLGITFPPQMEHGEVKVPSDFDEVLREYLKKNPKDHIEKTL